MRWISTKLHGVIDYLMVLTLLALPRMMGWSDNTTTLLTIVAVMALLSGLTHYKSHLSPVKIRKR